MKNRRIEIKKDNNWIGTDIIIMPRKLRKRDKATFELLALIRKYPDQFTSQFVKVKGGYQRAYYIRK